MCRAGPFVCARLCSRWRKESGADGQPLFALGRSAGGARSSARPKRWASYRAAWSVFGWSCGPEEAKELGKSSRTLPVGWPGQDSAAISYLGVQIRRKSGGSRAARMKWRLEMKIKRRRRKRRKTSQNSIWSERASKLSLSLRGISAACIA